MLGTYPDAKGIPRVKRRNTTKVEANADGQIGCLLKKLSGTYLRLSQWMFFG